MKLTASNVRTETLEKGKSEAIIFDDDVPGFGLRLRAEGSRTFVFQYKLGAKQRRMSLGSATAVSVVKAREIAAHLHARVKLGADPASDKADARKRASETFKATADEYLAEQRTRLRPRSYPDLERHLLRHARTLHELQLAKIERRDIATVIAVVAKNSGLVTGNRVRTSLSSLFAWAIERGLVDANPVVGTARNKERPRDRVLTPNELRAIWNALPENHFGAVIKLLALTGQRASEIAGLRWSEISESMILLSGERTKNHRPHTIPLSEPARAIIAAQQGHDGRDLVFGRYAATGPFSGWSRSKSELDARIAETAGKPFPHWTPHDLRRSFATHAAEIGIQPHIIEAVLNHVSGHRAGVAGIYNRASYETEKRTALNLWAEHLLSWVEGREHNVTTLRRA